MADTNGAPAGEYRREMDGPAHEATYSNFVHFTTVSCVFVACCVLALAVGGIKQGWLSSVIGILFAIGATGVGLFSPSLSWRPPAVVLGVLFLMLVFY